MGDMTIGEVAHRVGIQPSAIRYYESAGLLPRAARVNKRRRYDPEVLRRLAIIQIAQQAGFTVAEMRDLFVGFSPETPPLARWRALAEAKLPEIDALIARATEMKRLLEDGLRCGCLRLEDCHLIEYTFLAREGHAAIH
jgi:MerR family redox-sensitive transcriptional activator SoxR